MKQVTLREYDFLIAGDGNPDQSGWRHAISIPKLDFDYLSRLLAEEERKKSSDDHALFLKRTSWRSGVSAFQVQNYVGVIQTPYGMQIEILPKISDATDDGNMSSRKTLLHMLRYLKDAKFKLGGDTRLDKAPMHLLELFMAYFLDAVNTLVKRGIRSDYVVKEENQAFLKGKLLVHQQIRVNAVQQQRFYCAYDEYLPDRPENRLIHTALEKVSRLSRNTNNQRLSRELLFAFADVPVSRNVRQDFSKCKTNRAMTHYHHPLEWSRLILDEQSTVPSAGKTQTISILFPMEKIFENYVAGMLRKHMPAEYSIATQHSGKYLCESPKMFGLKPDIVITKGEQRWIADTKWKVIDKTDRNHGISQSDMYQLFAYGKKYVPCKGLFLIYPKSSGFVDKIDFRFDKMLKLSCLPFELFRKSGYGTKCEVSC